MNQAKKSTQGSQATAPAWDQSTESILKSRAPSKKAHRVQSHRWKAAKEKLGDSLNMGQRSWAQGCCFPPSGWVKENPLHPCCDCTRGRRRQLPRKTKEGRQRWDGIGESNDPSTFPAMVLGFAELKGLSLPVAASLESPPIQ